MINDEFKSKITKLYNEIININSGKVADYIPQLAKVNPELFGISICDVRGTKFSIGDSKIKFCLQSCCKPILYCIAKDLCGKETVHKHIGHEPSGQKFNAFILNEENKPHNPMINAGAIMSSSLILPNEDPAERFDCVKKYLSQLSGNGIIEFDNSVFLSERTHASRNKALAYFMEEVKAYPNNTNINKTLEFYFQNCSVLSDCNTLSVIAATLANGGICPTTEQKVFSREIIRDCLSLMYTCGMYDYTGRFAFEIGLPAKSGVSGCILLIVPGEMGICIWSPKLDNIGNSVRGIEFCKRFVELFPDYHIFNNLTKEKCPNNNLEKLDKDTILTIFITAASNNDIEKIEKIVKYVDINQGDYDKRTALHLACANGEINMVKKLLELGAIVNVKDRWGNTPIHETKINMKKNKDKDKYSEILILLESYNK